MADSDRRSRREDRAARLAEALKANLRRRKDQARGRRAGEGEETPPESAPDRPADG